MSAPMTDAELAEIRSLAAREDALGHGYVCRDVPDLIDEIQRLRARERALTEVLEAVKVRGTQGRLYITIVGHGDEGWWSVDLPDEMARVARSWADRRSAALKEGADG